MTAQIGGSIVALVTPMTLEGQIDTKAYERLLEYHLDSGTAGVVIGGTTGESPTLTPAELSDLVHIAAGSVGDRMQVIAGSGTNNTAASVALTQRVCEAGAQACLAVTPYYNKPEQEGLFQHYTQIADAATVPVILYNVPGRTGCDLLPATVARLASHPRITTIKEATGDIERTREILALCGDQIDVVSGDDATALALIKAGATGVISVTGNVAPAAMARLCHAALDGNWQQAEEIDQSLRALHAALFIEANPIPVKYAAEKLGLIDGGLRLPLTPLSNANHDRVVAALRQAGLEVSN
ncbi:MAG: 4-hydroxy-tetrahydrodipicolinate synthase [Gammaproteobacteria bacterium]|nr:4-hydroxy-tetrahydrodipicolinate synthase [Gammaproteobacteria bacterium]